MPSLLLMQPPAEIAAQSFTEWVSGVADRPAVLFFGVLVPIVVIVVLVSSVVRRRRRGAAQAWAQARGWTYAERDADHDSRWSGAPFDKDALRETADEVLTGTWNGRPAAAFRHVTVAKTNRNDTTTSRENQTTTTRHVVTLAVPGDLGRVTLTPAGLGDRISARVGRGDVEIGDAAFDAAWTVTSKNPTDPPRLLTPTVVERLMREDARGMGIRIHRTDLISWVKGGGDLDEIERRLVVLDDLATLLPVQSPRA